MEYIKIFPPDQGHAKDFLEKEEEAKSFANEPCQLGQAKGEIIILPEGGLRKTDAKSSSKNEEKEKSPN